MKVIISDYFPFHGYVAMALYKWILWRSEYDQKLNEHPFFERTFNHESIHEAQMRDYHNNIAIGGTIFYIIYFFDWLYKVLFKYPFSHRAYKNICFEREAFKYEKDLDYLEHREKFAWKNIPIIKEEEIKIGDEIYIVTKWSDLGWHTVQAIEETTNLPMITIGKTTVHVNLSSIQEIRKKEENED